VVVVGAFGAEGGWFNSLVIACMTNVMPCGCLAGLNSTPVIILGRFIKCHSTAKAEGKGALHKFQYLANDRYT